MAAFDRYQELCKSLGRTPKDVAAFTREEPEAVRLVTGVTTKSGKDIVLGEDADDVAKKLGKGKETETVTFLSHSFEILRAGRGGDAARARELVAEYDGQVEALALDGLPAQLRLGNTSRPHLVRAELPKDRTLEVMELPAFRRLRREVLALIRNEESMIETTEQEILSEQ